MAFRSLGPVLPPRFPLCCLCISPAFLGLYRDSREKPSDHEHRDLPAAEVWCSGTEAYGEDDVRNQVWGLLAALYPRGDLAERRGEQRYPYPYLVQLTPVAADGVTPVGESLVVVGKHLSERGLGFYHPRPIAYRRVIAFLETTSGAAAGFPHRPELVPLHPARMVRERRPVPASGHPRR